MTLDEIKPGQGCPAHIICIVVLCIVLGSSNSFSKMFKKDSNNDGDIDMWAYYDEDGNLVKIEIDSNFDGKLDEWRYFEKGDLLRVESDINHNGKIVVSETDERFLPDIADLESRIDGNTRAVIMNTPNNPTGRAYDEAILKQVGELLREKSKKYGKPIFLISDEPYRKIVFSDSKYFAPVKFYENTVIVTSFSKDLSIPGERIGYIAVNPVMENKEELIDACIFCNRILGFINAPALMQRVIRNVIEFSVDVEVYEKRRNLLFESLKDMGYDIVKPEGTFYMFPRSPIDDDVEFSKVLREELVLVTPGVGFGRAGYFRISFCVDEKVIEKSLERFERAIRKIR